MTKYYLATSFYSTSNPPDAQLGIEGNPWGDGFPTFTFNSYDSTRGVKSLSEFGESMYNKGNKGFVLISEGYMDCREILISSVRTTFEHIAYCVNNFGYRPATVFVGIPKDDYEGFAERWEKFGKVFFGNKRSMPISMHVSGNKCILGVRLVRYDYASALYFLSAILWLFRQGLDEIVIEKIGDVGNPRTMALELSKLFIQHPNWGDNYNSPLQISMSLYAFSKGIYQTNGYGGPSTAGAGLNFTTTLKYLAEVFVPMYPNVTWLESAKFGAIDESLQTSISSVLKLMHTSAEKK